MKESSKSKKLTKNKIIILLLLLIITIIAVVGFVGYLFYSSNNLPFVNQSNQEEMEVEEIVENVGRLIILPDGTPEIATVSDIELLREQTIFRNAQNGDKVLIFGNARKAIVYRPSENIIVDVGNLVVAPGGEEDTSVITDLDEEVEELPASVVVLNATTTAGYAGRIGDELSEEFSNIEIESTGNASGEYDTVLVIDVSGEFSDLAQAIADELDGVVDELSDDEDDQGADILVILGE